LRRRRNTFYIAISALSLAILLSACRATIRIGTQTWTVKNLSVQIFRNGDTIPQAMTDEEWIHAAQEKKPAWCYYQNDSLNGKKYGKLYNWYAVSDRRGLAPKGLHIPDNEEWKILADCLGGEKVAGGKLKAKPSWDSPNIGATDSCMFSGLPGGLRDYDGTFNGLGSSAGWWTASAGDTERAWDWFLLYNSAYIHATLDAKALGLSVRCLKNK